MGFSNLNCLTENIIPQNILFDHFHRLAPYTRESSRESIAMRVDGSDHYNNERTMNFQPFLFSTPNLTGGFNLFNQHIQRSVSLTTFSLHGRCKGLIKRQTTKNSRHVYAHSTRLENVVVFNSCQGAETGIDV